MEILGTFLAGLGLFFIGVKTVTKNLKESSSRKFKLLLSKWTNSSILTSFVGFLSGTVTQSSAGATFILVGLISSGLLTVRAALPLINWANIGTSSLIFFAALDIKVMVFYLIGLAGLIMAFNKPLKLVKLSGLLYGIGLLFFGLILLKQSSGIVSESEIVKSFLLNTKGSFLLALVAGIILRIIAQSSSAVSVIAITMAGSGLFSIEQTMMIIYGTNIGAGASTYFMSSNLSGSSKQIALFQVWLNYIGAILFVPLLYVEYYFNIPLIRDLAVSIGSNLAEQMAFVYLFNKLFTGILLSPFYKQITNKLEKVCKPSEEDEISKSKYLTEFSLEDPDTALLLIEKEQNRLVNYFTNYLDYLRLKLNKQKKVISPKAINNGITTGIAEIQDYLTDLVDKDISHFTSEKLINLQNRHGHIEALNDTLHEFVKTIKKNEYSEELKSLIENLIEGTDTILLTLISCMKNKDLMEIEIVSIMTSSKSDLMEKIRKNYLTQDKLLNETDKITLLMITNIFEKIVWLSGSVAKLLTKDLKSSSI